MKILITVLALLASVFVVESAVAAAPATLETAPTKFVDAGGTHFEYRTIVTKTDVPLVLLQHFTDTVDYWVPAIVNGLTKEREVIVFDNTGVGASSGKAPDSVEQRSNSIPRCVVCTILS
jgi:pimeloyl-ACP methyl ester carboxylesterase